MRSAEIFRGSTGVTLVEMIIATCIVTVVAVISVQGVKLLNMMFAKRAMLEVKRDGQTAYYSIMRDIRNCKTPIYITSDTIKLQTFDFKRWGYDDNTNLFDEVNLGTVTYRYVMAGPDRYLERTAQFPGGTTTTRVLKNLLDTVDTTNYFFRGVPLPTTPPWDSIDVALRFKPHYIYTSTFSVVGNVAVKSRGG